MASEEMPQAVKELQQVPANNQRLKRKDFDLSNGAANARTKIASFQAQVPLAFREKAVRMVFITVEEFQSDGTAGNTETFNLSHNALQTSNTGDFVLYENGNRVQPDAVDYSANSFDYTDDGTGNYLHAYYVPRDPVQVEVVKRAPKAQGRVEDPVFDDTTSILHERDQHRDPPEMDFDGDSPLSPIVPRKWTVDIYAEGPVPFEWDDSDETNSQGTTAVNAVVSLPIKRAESDVDGLAQAVREDIIT